MPQPAVGRLHVLTDVTFQTRHTHAELAALACAGGADTVQFRDKHGALRARLEALRETVAACRAASVPCLANDDVALALAAAADGVQLGQEDLPIPDARRLAPRPAIVGATATTAAQARAAEAEGADYIGFGPVFPTASKANPASVKGLAGLAEACAAVSVPVVAIAGITVDRVAPCLAAGAWGVAVMTAVTTAGDVEAATRAFGDRVDAWLHESGLTSA